MTAQTWPAAPPAEDAPRLDWARFYIEELGWRIIPQRPLTNESSLLPSWAEYRETPHAALLDNWRAWLDQWPTANMAVITGAPSGVLVLDIDEAKGGRTSLEVSGLNPPVTLMDKSPGGFHAYYALPPGADPRGADGLLPGVDSKAKGGCLTLPPSYRRDKKYPDGAAYAWLKARWMAPVIAPDWLLDPSPMLHKQQRIKTEVDGAQPDWVAHLMTQGSAVGTRNRDATRLAGYFLAKDLPDDIIVAVMLAFGSRCDPPMDGGELLGVVKSVRQTKQRARLAGIQHPPVEVNIGSGWRYEFEDDRVTVQLRDVERGRAGVYGELSVFSNLGAEPRKLVGPVMLDLMKAKEHHTHALLLAQRLGGPDWVEVLSRACDMALHAWREGDPWEMLGVNEPEIGIQWAIRNLILANNVTMLYADSNLGKSLIALIVALSIALGEDLGIGSVPEIRRRVLYLDTEWTREDHDRRVFPLIGRREGGSGVLYHALNTSLWEAKSQIAERVRSEGIGYIVLDSAAGAVGGKPEDSESVINLFKALRQIGVGAGIGCTIVAHITNDAARKATVPDRPFGSAYWRSYSRLMWYLTKVQDVGSHALDVALVNTKANAGPPLRTWSFHVDFGDVNGQGLQVRNQDVRHVARLAERVLNTAQRIIEALRPGPLSFEDLRMRLVDDDGRAPSEDAMYQALARLGRDTRQRDGQGRIIPDSGRPPAIVRLEPQGQPGQKVRYALAVRDDPRGGG